MKRLGLVAMLLLTTALSAHADYFYKDITRHRRTEDVLQADGSYCAQMLGEPQTGAPVSKAYKGCMLRRGWRYAGTQRTAPSDLYPDPDGTGLMCRDFAIGTSCSSLY